MRCSYGQQITGVRGGQPVITDILWCRASHQKSDPVSFGWRGFLTMSLVMRCSYGQQITGFLLGTPVIADKATPSASVGGGFDSTTKDAMFV